MIAMALANEPDLLIADEPTTALDVTIQAQIIALIRQLQTESGMAMILITHDLGVVAEVADEVVVMYAGQVVESGPVDDIFADPQHPYTIGLMGSVPSLGRRKGRLTTIPGTVPPAELMPRGCRFSPRCPFVDERCVSDPPPLVELAPGHRARCWYAPLELHRETHPMSDIILESKGLVKHFGGSGLLSSPTIVRAVDGVSMIVRRGETFAIVGESGCGKSTLGRLLLRLIEPTAGDVRYEGKSILELGPKEMRRPAPRDADHLPGSLRLAQPAHECARHRRRADLAS